MADHESSQRRLIELDATSSIFTSFNFISRKHDCRRDISDGYYMDHSTRTGSTMSMFIIVQTIGLCILKEGNEPREI